jgi:cytochrome b561
MRNAIGKLPIAPSSGRRLLKGKKLSMKPQSKPGVAIGIRVACVDDRTRYDTTSITLHWLTAALVLAQFALAELWGYAARPTRHLMITAHMSFGIVLATVLLGRIIWRLTPGHRVRPATTGWAERAAKLVQFLLYMLLVAQVALGFLLRWSGGEAMGFFGLEIPPPFASFSKPVHHLIGEAHNWVGWAIIILAAGHAAAALIHRYVLHDDVLSRMLPGRRHSVVHDGTAASERTV